MPLASAMGKVVSVKGVKHLFLPSQFGKIFSSKYSLLPLTWSSCFSSAFKGTRNFKTSMLEAFLESSIALQMTNFAEWT